MTKEEAEKELVHVVNDILNPYRDRESEIEAYLLAEEGWRLVPQAEWIPQTRYIERWGAEIVDCYECSNCGNIENTNDKNYCPNCGAEMKRRGDKQL